MKKKVYLVMLSLFLSLPSYATAQFGDILIWKGDTMALFSNPLTLRSDYDSLQIRIMDEIESQDRLLHPEKYKSDTIESIYSTACWRGYVAEWIIVEDHISLSNIYHCHDRSVKIDLKKIFPDECRQGLIFAGWVNGELISPQGNCIEYVHMGYESIYEKETVFEFEGGLLTGTKIYHKRVVKESNFYKDNLNQILEFLYSNINWKDIPDLEDKHIQVYVGIQPNENGSIDSILTKYTHMYAYMLDGIEIITDQENIFIKETIRIAKLIPDWDVIYQRDKIVARGLSLLFDENQRKKYAR